MGVFLKAAEVASESADTVTLLMPAGPGLERMGDVAVRRQVEDALSTELGRKIRIEATAAEAPGRKGAAPAERLTPEKVKQDQLARMSRDEPVIGKAVQEWDLELLD